MAEGPGTLEGVSPLRATSATGRPLGSRVLHVIDRAASRTLVAALVVLADLAWVAYSALAGFPSQAETVFQTLVGALTLAMVFIIQHTQAREQITFHRKLDEILRALPHADNTLLALEDAPDAALTASRTTHRSLREQALAAANDPRHQTPTTRHIPSRPQTHRPAAAPSPPGSAPNPR